MSFYLRKITQDDRVFFYSPLSEWYLLSPSRITNCDVWSILNDAARNTGEHTCIVVNEQDDVVGVSGWVELGTSQGELFVAPLIAADDKIYRLLIDFYLDYARQQGFKLIKIGCVIQDSFKFQALKQMGFEIIDTLTHIVLTANKERVIPLPSVKRISMDMLTAKDLSELITEIFSGISTSPPVSEVVAQSILNNEKLDRQASSVLVNKIGIKAAFCLVYQNGLIDSIGVIESLRQQGIGRYLISHAVNTLLSRDIEPYCEVLSSNSISLSTFFPYIKVEDKISCITQRNV